MKMSQGNGYGYEARFVECQRVTVKDFEAEYRYRMTIRASLPLPKDEAVIF